MIGKNKVGDSVLLQVVRGGAAVACSLERRGELALGLETDTTSFGCRVKKLVAAGAGATAGLRVDDVITDVNGMPTGSTDQLNEIYAALEPDAEVTFAVLRNSRLVSVRVTFVGEYSEQRR
jgi:S1-C subfamily serine protease